MARKQKKKQKARRAATRSGAAQGPVTGAGARRYHLEKAARLLGRGRDGDARAVLARLWPEGMDAVQVDWLATHWPSEAAARLGAEAPDAACLAALDEALLSLDGGAVEALGATLGAAWRASADAVRAASGALAAGEAVDVGAAESAHPRSWAFLAGLQAWYRRDEAAAEAAWAALPAGGRLARAVGALRAASPDPLDVLGPTLAALEAKNADRALREAAVAWPQLDAAHQVMLARTLSGALVACGLRPETAWHRMRRTLPELRTVLAPLHLDAFCEPVVGSDMSGWFRLIERGGLTAVEKGAVEAFIGVQMLDMVEGVLASDWADTDVLARAHELRVDALAALNRAVAHDPEAEDTWEMLFDHAHNLAREDELRVVRGYAAQFPERAEAWIGLAEAAGFHGEWAEGLEALARAEALAPGSADVADVKGTVLVQQARGLRAAGDEAGAVAGFAAAMAVEGRSETAWLAVAAEWRVVADRLGRADEVAAVTALAEDGTHDPWVWAGNWLSAEGYVEPVRTRDDLDVPAAVAATPPVTAEGLNGLLELLEARGGTPRVWLIVHDVLVAAAASADLETLDEELVARLVQKLGMLDGADDDEALGLDDDLDDEAGE